MKNTPANAGDTGDVGSTLVQEDHPKGNPLQYSCRENPMDREVWRATVHEVANESDMTEGLNSNNRIQSQSRKHGCPG